MSVTVDVMNRNPVGFIDPSEMLRPELTFAAKPVARFRDFTIDLNDPIKERVRRTYTLMHTNQTVEFVRGKIEEYSRFDKMRATIMEALTMLNDLVDEGDPDIDLPNAVHAFQTAERIRLEHPDQDWFQLTGLIHDLGKIMVFFNEPQWAVVGDTFVVGCEWADSIAYRDSTFGNNPDGKNPKYNTKYGMYAPNCGLENVLISWGHDEYMYRVLKHNKCTLPEEALFMIRYHSLYPWHAANDYMHLCNEKDANILQAVLKFNKFDLYTKSQKTPDIEKLIPYYQSLIDKYIPGKLYW